MIGRIQIAFGAAILTLLVLGGISYRTISLAGESDLWVRHTHEVLENLAALLTAAEDMESSYRGFALTAQQSYLQSYASSIAGARRHQVTVQNLTRDNAAQQRRLPALEALLTQEAAFAESVVGLRQSSGIEAAARAIQQGTGQELMDGFQALVRSMQDEELRLLILRTSESGRRLEQTKVLLLGGALLGLLISLAAGWSAHRDERRRALSTAELRRSREQLLAVLEHIGDAVVVAYADGRFMHYNPAAHRILGRGPSEGDPAQWAQQLSIFRPDGITPFPADELPLARAIRGEATDQVDLVVRPSSCAQLAFLTVTGRPIHDAEGHIVGGVVILHDITERRRAEEKLTRAAQELRDSNQDLERFAFVASHDLQAPLRMVTSYIELIERRYAGELDDDAREFIGYALSGARRMQSLTTDLLALSRLGTRPPAATAVDAMQTLDEVLLTLRQPITDAGATVSRDPLPQVLADPVQLGQIFQNLIINALKFHGEQPTQIHVSAHCGDGSCEFLVADNGPGISPEHRERIFEMFERLPGADNRPGTGIGLATCKKIIERHGGRIWVESAAAASAAAGTQARTGSVFHFTLPAASAEQSAAGHRLLRV